MKEKPRLSRFKNGLLSLLLASGASTALSMPLVEPVKKFVNKKIAHISTGVRYASGAVSDVFKIGIEKIKHGGDDIMREVKREAACAVVEGISHGVDSAGLAAAGIATGTMKVIVDTGLQIREWSEDLAEWGGEDECDTPCDGEITIAARDTGS